MVFRRECGYKEIWKFSECRWHPNQEIAEECLSVAKEESDIE